MLELALALVTSIVMKFAPVCFSTEYDFSPPSPYKCLHNIWTVPWIAWISDVSTILGDSSTTGTYPEYGKINLKISRFDNKTYSETALHLSLANQNFMLWSPISYTLQIVWQLINVDIFTHNRSTSCKKLINAKSESIIYQICIKNICILKLQRQRHYGPHFLHWKVNLGSWIAWYISESVYFSIFKRQNWPKH